MIAAQIIASGLDRLFAQTPGARAALAPHAGRVLALDLELLRVPLRLEEGGSLRLEADAAAEAVIFLMPGTLLPLAEKERGERPELRGEGDAELLSAFNSAFAQLDLGAEAELSRLFGPVLGFRLAEAGRAFGSWMKQAGEDGARALAEYAVQEASLLAGRAEMDRFRREAGELREAVDRLEARLSRLEKAA